jgi:peptide/nickel transport system ATP-binding protein
VNATNVSSSFSTSTNVVGLGKPDGERIIDGVSLQLREGETLCVVGESGSEIGDVADRDGAAARARWCPRAAASSWSARTARRQRPPPAAIARHRMAMIFRADDSAQPGGPGRPPDRRVLRVHTDLDARASGFWQ